jgi:predicted AlkP superfamily phosphohydrolase/phosphomutase
MRPVLVLGLDGATFDVIEPLVRAGRLPHLGAWLKEGTSAPLPSTIPAMTFPSWSSFLTGLPPGSHGMFDFTQKVAGAYRVRFTNATDRTGATLPARVSAAGGTVICLGVPATWPPEPVSGLLVPGFDAPISTGSDASLASDPGLYRRIAARTGPWMQPGLDESAHADGWHERALEALLGRVRRKTDFACAALSELRAAGRAPDLLCVVFAESDTVAHHFWRDHDPASPRHDPAASAARRSAVASVYEALDAACGELRAAFGPEAACIVVSDHGSGGASRTVVQLNRYLAECGLLRRSPRRALAADLLARGARDLALRVVPPALAQAIFRRARPAAARLESAARFGGFDWSRTAAFSEEANTQPGVWINAAGRERAGSVPRADYERVRREVIDALLDWKLPGGGRVVARARPREEVHAGPFCERAPDVVVELGLEDGYSLSLVQTPWNEPAPGGLRHLGDHELAGGRGRGMNGTHRPDGIWLANPASGRAPGSIVGAGPAIAAVLRLRWEDAGRAGRTPRTHTPEEEAVVADRLRALGYLE